VKLSINISFLIKS